MSVSRSVTLKPHKEYLVNNKDMKASLDCIPCFVRQSLDAARMASNSPSDHKRIMRDMLPMIGELDTDKPPPALGQLIHRRLRHLSGSEDPYRDAKAFQNRIALSLLPMLKREVDDSTDPLITAVRLAIAGNVLSMTATGNITESDVHKSIRQALEEPFHMEDMAFRQAVAEAKYILYLADNAGEIVFDRLLIEQLLPTPVKIAVRGAPVINDATRTDAEAAGLHEIVEIMDNGSDAPGTILEDCNNEFRRCFNDAELIVAKGQANFETLDEEPRNIFFLFKAKCPVVAAHIGVPVGTHILRRQFVGS